MQSKRIARNVYPTSDGYIAIICVGDVHWRSLLTAMGRADEAAEPRFATLGDRVAHVDEIDRVVGEWTAGFGKHALFYRLPARPAMALRPMSGRRKASFLPKRPRHYSSTLMRAIRQPPTRPE